ncbi:EH signature protein [Halanaerobium saccharolyticum]|uniref:EH signature protein n=1 Tax=Halanaerobium saccharolyticum TaxID=43595 RepID=A0A4R6SJ38_9FIRM|nr:EH signature domain-containing protein [Halanaerobium saccharolyticum]TDQ04048.1 EH signature protein [Halanaerobium saccharolyticum]
MNTTYKLPDFSYFQPKKVKKIAEKVDRNIDKIMIPQSDTRLDRAIEKLKSKHRLSRNDYKILFYNLQIFDNDESEFLMDRLISNSEKYFNEEGRYLYHFKALLSSFYDIYNNKLLRLLKLILENNINWKDEMNYVKSKVAHNNTIGELFYNTLEEINNISTKDDLLKFKSKLLINDKNKFLEELFLKYFRKNLKISLINKKTELMLFILNNYLSWEKQKVVFEDFLLIHKDIYFDDISKFSSKWFRLISEKMGNPYGKSSAKWGDVIEEARDVFKNWLANHKITEFFEDISGDNRRLKFWKQYAHHFYRIEYLYDLIILLETKEHLFVEFSNRASGKFLLYDLKKINIDKIQDYYEDESKTFVIQLLKNAYNYYDKEHYEQKLALVHRHHDWESTFAEELIKYGYEPR